MSASNVETPLEAEDAIVKRWLANWTGTAETFLANEAHRPTNGVAHSILTVVPTGGGDHTLGAVGNRKFLRLGRVSIEIKVPADAGTATANGLAHDARAIFEGTSFSGLRFFSGDVLAAGLDGGWLSYVALIPFDYHETK